jgi:quercetin dioxygenase-like cupin family protein
MSFSRHLFHVALPISATNTKKTTRTAWHTHPLGQTLIVTSGCDRVQLWGGSIEEIRPGRLKRGRVYTRHKRN